MFDPSFVVQYLLSFLVLQWKERTSCFTFVFLMASGCWCSVSLPDGAVSWSAVCGCGISWT